MKKYSIALPIQRNRILGSGNPFYFLALIDEVWLPNFSVGAFGNKVLPA